LLTSISTEIPTADELLEAAAKLGATVGASEYLAMSLSTLLEPESPETFEISAAQAWYLTYYARRLRLDANVLRANADNIERCVESLYSNYHDPWIAEVERKQRDS
jgi:hypothetical protein